MYLLPAIKSKMAELFHYFAFWLCFVGFGEFRDVFGDCFGGCFFPITFGFSEWHSVVVYRFKVMR